jgi:hypothetical protein
MIISLVMPEAPEAAAAPDGLRRRTSRYVSSIDSSAIMRSP